MITEADIAEMVNDMEKKAVQQRLYQTMQFVVALARIRNDIDIKLLLGQGTNRYVETLSISLSALRDSIVGNATPTPYYIGATLAGAVSANQTLVNVQTQGGSEFLLINEVGVIVNGKTAAIVLMSDLFALGGQLLNFTKPYGQTLSIPIERCLSMGLSAASAAAGADQMQQLRTYRTSIDNPLLAIKQGDKWGATLSNANGAACVGGHTFQVVLAGQQLRIGQ
jgi:hypothetical protein